MPSVEIPFGSYTFRFWPDKETPSTRDVGEKLRKLSSPDLDQLLGSLWVPYKAGPKKIKLIFFYRGVPIILVRVTPTSPYSEGRCSYKLYEYDLEKTKSTGTDVRYTHIEDSIRAILREYR